MKSHILQLYILMVAIPLAVFSSCSSDEKEEFQATPNQTDLVGSWYFEDGDGSYLNRTIYNYFADGTYTFETINMANLLDSKATKEKGSGIFHVSNNELRRGQNTVGGQGWLDPVNYTRKGSQLTLSSKFDLSNQTFHLIVDSCRLQKGESIAFNYNGEYGQPYKYSTSSTLVATVSENGQIKANELGVAYITGHCKTNDVVIKVTVENGDKVTPDFMDDIWMPRDSVIRKYGTSYVQSTLSGTEILLHYIYGSDQIQRITFKFNKKDRVNGIFVYYWPSIDMSESKAYLDQNYPYWEDHENGRIYLKKIGQRDFRCTLDTLQRMAYYAIETLNYDEFDEAIYETVDEVLHKSIKGSNVLADSPGYLEALIDNNEIFEKIVIGYDENTHEIIDIQLEAHANITPEELTEWATNNYQFIRNPAGHRIFVNRTDIWNQKPLVQMAVVMFHNGRAGLYYYKQNII